MHMKGAIEQVLPRCDQVFLNGRVQPLSSSHREAIKQECRRLAADAKRILAFACRRENGSFLEEHLVFTGLIYVWAAIPHIFRKGGNLGGKVLVQVACASFLLVLLDWETGWRGWSVSFALPIVFSAGIVGAHVKTQGVVLSKENIADEKRNFTRFLRLVRREEARPKRSEKVFFCATCKHRPGSLYELLGVFARSGINLTRIESRPIRDVFGEYRFFIEIDGDIARKEVVSALKKAGAFCRQFHIIGAY